MLAAKAVVAKAVAFANRDVLVVDDPSTVRKLSFARGDDPLFLRFSVPKGGIANHKHNGGIHSDDNNNNNNYNDDHKSKAAADGSEGDDEDTGRKRGNSANYDKTNPKDWLLHVSVTAPHLERVVIVFDERLPNPRDRKGHEWVQDHFCACPAKQCDHAFPQCRDLADGTLCETCLLIEDDDYDAEDEKAAIATSIATLTRHNVKLGGMAGGATDDVQPQQTGNNGRMQVKQKQKHARLLHFSVRLSAADANIKHGQYWVTLLPRPSPRASVLAPEAVSAACIATARLFSVRGLPKKV